MYRELQERINEGRKLITGYDLTFQEAREVWQDLLYDVREAYALDKLTYAAKMYFKRQIWAIRNSYKEQYLNDLSYRERTHRAF